MIFIFGLFLFSSSASAATGINKQINFQGKVTNTDGTNVANNSYTFLFCIYTTASPSTACTSGADNDAVWRESKSITVTDGVFQTNLGDTTAFASLVDFNTDNIYLGINFNANGQMTPLVRFTAAPYAMNAGKVAGLTVTDTTGTLTIPAGKTVSFADAFTTSGAFATTLTSTATTNATLPAGTITLADLTTGQTLTNKIIGSTGLTFTGAATDITTGTGEDLTITANGSGIISLSDAVSVANTLTANGGISLTGGQSLTAGALSYVDLGSIVHNTTAVQGLRLPQAASATPSNPTAGEGYLAWDAAGNQLITYNGSSWTTIGGSIAADSLDFTDFKDTMALDGNLTLNQTTNTWAQTFTGDTTTGLTYTADSLTSGTAFAVSSSATAFTGSLANITLSGSNAANTGSLLALNNTGTANANTTLLIQHNATGTNNLAFRVNDIAADTTPFVIDGGGQVGIGTAAPTTPLELYGSGADIVSTITVADATYDPILKFRTGVSPSIQFSLGVDNSDSGKFKIYSGDGLGSGDEFTIDSNGVTTIANLNLGAVSFDADAGIVSWADMPVTSSASAGTVESYTAQIDGNALLTVYAESDGAGSIQNSGVSIGNASLQTGSKFAITQSSTSTTASSTLYGAYNSVTDTGVVTATGDNTYGSYTTVTRTGSTTAGTYNSYGDYVTVTADNAGAATSNAYGIYSTVSGADNNYSGVFMGGNFGIGDATPDGLLDLDFSQTSGTLYGASAPSGVTLAGTLTGISLNLSTNVTATGQSITAVATTLPAVTNTGAGSYNYYGENITGNAIIQNTGAGVDTFIGVNVTNPNITQTTGTVVANGMAVTTGSITTGGTQNGVSITATGVGAGTLYGMNISGVTAGAGTETAIEVGAGWDTGMNLNANTLINIGNAGTDFIASTGALTLAGVLTANGGISIGTQALTGTTGIIDYTNFDVDATGNITVAVSKGLDTNAAGSIQLGKTNATSVDICNSANCDTINIGNLATTDADTIIIGDVLDTTSINSTGWTITGAGALSVASVTVSGAIAANGGITFDASTDTVGAHTLSGTIDANANILTNIGNAGTDFVASTGALTLAGVLTANGGISLAGSQSLTAGALSYVDLGAIVHNTTAIQGLRLPQAASATPSNPTSGEGYLAWDAAGNQLITYNGSAWTTLSGGSGYNLIKNETTGLTARTTLAFLGAGVDCADSGSQTECTIAGGSGADLQGTYDADANGSNVTISLTAADDGLIFTNPTSGGNDLSNFLLQLTQQNTTANMLALDIVQSSNASNAVNLVANAIDGETGLAITTNGLTSGKGISVTSSVASNFTGNLADISLTGSGASNTGNVLAVSNTGTANANTTLFVDHRATGTGNLAMRVDDASSDTTPFVIDGDGKVGIQTSVPTEALQVGSATNRANAAVYGDITSNGFDIQRSIAGIIDIFVYDTSRDSDGGEWRTSTLSQQLSWATETKDHTGSACVIGTDDRCGQSAFPRKAILVTTATALYIFDGGDNTLWMTFTQAGTFALGADTNNNPSGVGAQNGVIVVGTNGSAGTGMYAFDFKQDTMFRYNSTNRVQGDKNIGNRNTTVTYATDANTSMALVDTIVNDVSIAMITSSTEGMLNTLTLPIDSATSPVRGMTLIAAATDTGISVVNMGSRKTLSYSDVTNDDYNQVVLTSRARLYATNETQAQLEEWRNMDRDVVSELNGTPDRFYDETTPNGAAGKTPITTGTTPTMTTSPGSLAVIERSSSARESAATTLLESGDIVFVGTNQGLAEVHTSGGNLLGASWSKITTTTTATPYMVGAPRGVFLFDDAAGATSTSSAVGTTGTTRQVLTKAGATAPTFGGSGVRGTSVNFNNNSYLCSDANSDGTCDADTDFNAGTIGFTISLWFKHSVTAASDTLFERCYTPATPTVAVGCIWAGMTASGTIKIGLDSITTWTYETTYDDSVVSTAAYNDNQWHHMIYTNTDTDICLYIDGKQAAACDTSLAATATMDASQVLTVGGACSGANCTTGTNFWDGSIDDMVWSSNGATTDNGLAAQSATKIYLDGRAHLIRPAATVVDATTFSSTTIGDSGESYVPGSFAGLVVEINGGTGVGQTRTIVSNDATTFTVTPAWTTTPDTTSDYAVSPSRLYGSSNTVTAIAPDLPTNLNRTRKVYVGTSDGADGGGISVFTNAGTGSIKTEVIHSDAGYATDDLGATWSGTNADNISALAAYSDTIAYGNGAFFRAKRADVSLKQLQLDYGSALEDIRQELVSKQLFGSTQDVLGLGQGADLAERYYSNESLNAGEIVAIDKSQEAGVMRSSSSYQRDVIGIVATAPGIVLGPEERTPYPIALVGRVPVKVTNENGQIYAGDRITPSSRPGFGMFASQSGRVIGQALSDATDWVVCDDESTSVEHPRMCTTVLVFVNLADYSGVPVELAMSRMDSNSRSDQISDTGLVSSPLGEALAGTGASVRLASAEPTRQEKILTYLKKVRDAELATGGKSSEILTGRISASTEVITPALYADQIFAKSIKADSIEGLSIWTDQLQSLSEKYAGIEAAQSASNARGAGTTVASEQKAFSVALKNISTDAITVQLDGSILGKLSVGGALRIGGDAQFDGSTLFSKLVTFLSDTVFKGKVVFEQAPSFSSNTAGFAVIAEGQKSVDVVFDTAYLKQPIVSVSVTNDRSPLVDDAKQDAQLAKDVVAFEDDFNTAYFDGDIKYIVTKKSGEGFTILLNKKAPRELSFSWVAIAVNGAKTSYSEKETKSTPEESIIPPPVPADTATSSNSPSVPTGTPTVGVPQEEAVTPPAPLSSGNNTQADAPSVVPAS